MDPAQASLLEWMALVGRNQMPLLIVAVAGIVIAGAKWRRHPRTSRRVAAAFGLLLLQTIATTLRLALEVRGRLDARLAGEAYVEQLAGWVLPIALLGLAGIIVLASAVFVDRTGSAGTPS